MKAYAYFQKGNEPKPMWFKGEAKRVGKDYYFRVKGNGWFKTDGLYEAKNNDLNCMDNSNVRHRVLLRSI